MANESRRNFRDSLEINLRVQRVRSVQPHPHRHPAQHEDVQTKDSNLRPTPSSPPPIVAPAPQPWK